MSTTKTITNANEFSRQSYPAAPLEKRKRRPSHPGAALREVFLPAIGLSVQEMADRLGVSRHILSQILNETRSVTPDLANRLGRFFGNGASLWLNMQQQRDQWDILHADQSVYGSIEPLQTEEWEEADLMAA